jgi:hypothetical protein
MTILQLVELTTGRLLTQAEEGKQKQYDHNQTDQIDNPIHRYLHSARNPRTAASSAIRPEAKRGIVG